MPILPVFSPPAEDRAATLAELRRLLVRDRGWRQQALQQGFQQGLQGTLPFGLAGLDSHLPNGGLPCGALHEVVPATQAALPAAFGFVVAVLARLMCPPPTSTHAGERVRGPGGGSEKKIIFVLPRHGTRQCGHLSGHGLNSLGFDPRRAIVVEAANRDDTLWALLEALRSGAPQGVVGMIDRTDLKTSQRLQLAAADCGLPLLLLRPAQNLETSAAATRWRIGTTAAARDRFGTYAQPRWRLQLERCRNGRPGEWVVEYDHVAHRFSLVAALANQSLSRSASDQPRRQANRA
jgi:protein ImuA